ncbi:MAK10-like protein [Tanacetum coccineum]
MGDVNPIHTFRDYSKPSQECYRNTIELPVGNNVVPLRSDTIWLVQNGCSFHGLRSEDPNQHLKDFLKLVDSLDLDNENRERKRLRLFQFSIHDQASNWLERLPTTSRRVSLRSMDSFQGLSTKKDLSLYDNESLNDPRDFAKPVKAISLPQDVPSTSDHHLIELGSQVQCLMEAHIALMQPTQVSKITSSCEICSDPHNTQYCMENPKQDFVDYASLRIVEAGGLGIRTQQTKEPKPTLEDEFQDLHLNLPVLEVLAHAPIYNTMLDKYVESLELGKNESAFVQGEVSAKMQDPGPFTLPCRLGDSKPFDTLADLGSCVNIIPLCLFKKLNFRLLEETDHIFWLDDGTKSYPVGIVNDIEVHIGKLKLLNDFYVIDIKKDPETPLLVGRGFLATANVIIDCRKAKIAVGEGITRKDFLNCHMPGEWEIARDAEINPFNDVMVFRRMAEFLGALPINLKGMWELEDLMENLINWDKLPKDGDGAWHAKVRIIDTDGEEFTKTLKSIPTTRMFSERESPREIINLDHFYDT